MNVLGHEFRRMNENDYAKYTDVSDSSMICELDGTVLFYDPIAFILIQLWVNLDGTVSRNEWVFKSQTVVKV